MKLKCKLCKSERIKILFYNDKYPDVRGGRIIRCSNCGFIFRDNPQINQKNNQKNEKKIRRDTPAKFTNKRLKIIKVLISEAEKYRKTGRFLDVGSGYGHLIDLFSKYGWEAIGVEPNRELANYAINKFKLRVLVDKIENITFPDEYFDAITFINVLEHLDDPVVAINNAYKIIRPGGVIFFRFPNSNFHVTIRFIIYVIYKFWKGIKRIDGSCICQNSFNKKTIEKVFSDTDCKIYYFKNNIKPKEDKYKKNRSIDFKKRSSNNMLVQLKKLIEGKILIKSSIFGKAVKQINS